MEENIIKSITKKRNRKHDLEEKLKISRIKLITNQTLIKSFSGYAFA